MSRVGDELAALALLAVSLIYGDAELLGLACSTGKLNDADDFGGYSSVAVGVDCSIVAAMDVTVVESVVAADTVEVDRDEMK